MAYIYPDFKRTTSSIIRAKESIVTVIADSGAGKTTLLHHIAGQLCRSATVYMPARSRITTSHVCDALIADLTGRHHYGSLERRARILRDGLLRAGRIHLLIDDAHEIHSRTLRDMSGLVEMCLPARPLSIVLFGTPSLDYRISHESPLISLCESRLHIPIPPPPAAKYLEHMGLRDSVTPCAITSLDDARLPIRAMHATTLRAISLAREIGEKEASSVEVARVLGPNAPTETTIAPEKRRVA